MQNYKKLFTILMFFSLLYSCGREEHHENFGYSTPQESTASSGFFYGVSFAFLMLVGTFIYLYARYKGFRDMVAGAFAFTFFREAYEALIFQQATLIQLTQANHTNEAKRVDYMFDKVMGGQLLHKSSPSLRQVGDGGKTHDLPFQTAENGRKTANETPNETVWRDNAYNETLNNEEKTATWGDETPKDEEKTAENATKTSRKVGVSNQTPYDWKVGEDTNGKYRLIHLLNSGKKICEFPMPKKEVGSVKVCASPSIYTQRCEHCGDVIISQKAAKYCKVEHDSEKEIEGKDCKNAFHNAKNRNTFQLEVVGNSAHTTQNKQENDE